VGEASMLSACTAMCPKKINIYINIYKYIWASKHIMLKHALLATAACVCRLELCFLEARCPEFGKVRVPRTNPFWAFPQGCPLVLRGQPDPQQLPRPGAANTQYARSPHLLLTQRREISLPQNSKLPQVAKLSGRNWSTHNQARTR